MDIQAVNHLFHARNICHNHACQLLDEETVHDAAQDHEPFMKVRPPGVPLTAPQSSHPVAAFSRSPMACARPSPAYRCANPTVTPTLPLRYPKRYPPVSCLALHPCPRLGVRCPQPTSHGGGSASPRPAHRPDIRHDCGPTSTATPGGSKLAPDFRLRNRAARCHIQ